jgi:hypothetical protein
MKLSELMVDSKSAWVEYPGCDGFEVEVVNLSRPELTALRKRCVITKIDKTTRKPVEELNEDKFVSEFTKATIKNWKGLKYKYLENLVLVDLTKIKDPEGELEYSEESAKDLVSNSAEFDIWVNDTVFDLDNFRSRATRADVASAKKVAE